ncbi:ribose-5-phosphate isomerase RpiA [Peribacillus glennii]|uniref:Ribose-5-phosphate isomerase A n=1 Tax=Peribacillus glennii TaxID=2303991 RepID=A0A372L6P1_9BACI|nr:ribose-5-phosphate isomerase RpiA [Peribacillus glennii]RFU60764.1 ribose-5-phosphate isomerase RpiA [Peribacillus glennii]
MNAKKLAGEKALEYVKDGMVLGLGTGSTVYWTILGLGELVIKGLNIKGVATSKATEDLALKAGIPLVDISDVYEIDVTIDGADEVNPDLDLIKGGGGALLREKMVASVSRKLVIVADESKYSAHLGKFPLPVEVVPFGWQTTMKQISAKGCEPKLRMKNGIPMPTDNGNYILDCPFDKIEYPAALAFSLNMMPGVVETGLFVKMADTVILAGTSGEIQVKESAASTR